MRKQIEYKESLRKKIRLREEINKLESKYTTKRIPKAES